MWYRIAIRIAEFFLRTQLDYDAIRLFRNLHLVSGHLTEV